MEPKISIIVPVYNVEKYLERCVKSVLKQTLTNFELILVITVDKYVMSYHVKILVFECFIFQMEESLMQEI